MPRSFRFVAVAIVAAALAAVPCQAAPDRDAPTDLAGAAQLVISRVWSLVGGWWQSKTTGAADPNGQCGTAPGPACGQQIGGETTGAADPHGGETTGAMDPHG
jgi:hypothetical protein